MKVSVVTIIQNVVKRPGSVVSVPSLYYCAVDAFQTIKLRGQENFG